MFTKKTLILSLLLMVPLASNAFAATENHAGTNCVFQSNGVDVRYNHDGAIFNYSRTGTANVFCNIPHTDFDGFWNPGEVDGGWMQTIDLNPGQNVNCRVRSVTVNANGSRTINSGSMAITTGFGTARQHDTFGGVGENPNSSYFLNCHIPPRTNSGISRLFVYQIRQ